MSNKGSHILPIAGLLLVAMALLVTTAGCGSRAFPIGKYRSSDTPGNKIEFIADGTVVLSQAYGKTQIEIVRGKYSVSGNQITFLGDNYCGTTEATYTWAFDGQALKFTAVANDGCIDRQETLTGVSFVKE